MLHELDRVALLNDFPEYGLKAGDTGMIVHVYQAQPQSASELPRGCEVEFVTVGVEMVALLSLLPTQIRAPAHDEIASARHIELTTWSRWSKRQEIERFCWQFVIHATGLYCQHTRQRIKDNELWPPARTGQLRSADHP